MINPRLTAVLQNFALLDTTGLFGYTERHFVGETVAHIIICFLFSSSHDLLIPLNLTFSGSIYQAPNLLYASLFFHSKISLFHKTALTLKCLPPVQGKFVCPFGVECAISQPQPPCFLLQMVCRDFCLRRIPVGWE